MSVLSQPHFHNEEAAFAYLESIVWAGGVSCPHCGVVGGKVYDLTGVRGKPSVKNPEGAVRHGLKKCADCRKQFTVKVGANSELQLVTWDGGHSELLDKIGRHVRN